ATLVLHVAIGITIPVIDKFVGFSHDFGLASAVLLDFNHLAAPHKNVLAGRPDANGDVVPDANGNIVLDVGLESPYRKVYDITGTVEQTDSEKNGNADYTITHIEDDASGET